MNRAGIALGAAEQALAGGDAEGAIGLLAGLDDPAALHLRALALRRAHRLPEARQAFLAAIAAAPRDAQIANNFANLLRQSGEPAEALRQYDRALSIQPGYRDAAFNKALLLSETGEDAAALASLEKLRTAHPGDARVQSALGTVLRRLGRQRDAAATYEGALAASPRLVTALKGRAQVALELGQADAAARFEHALAADPADLDMVHGYAEALEAAGRTEGAAMLEEVLKARPRWLAGHLLLARIRAEQGDPDFAAGLARAAEANPGDRELALALASTLASAERWEEALAALPQAVDAQSVLVRAHYVGEAGDPAGALDLLASLPAGQPGSALIAARASLRLGEWERATALLETAVKRAPGDIACWALLELAWRQRGDPRAEWLSGQDGLIAVHDLGLDAAELAELADVLRGLHRTGAHPLGQSLRSGTQTRGALFLREEPILARLYRAVQGALAAYQGALPPADPAHPLLRHRSAPLAVSGSWSVRLSASGFHVSHIHPEGIVSSAAYIALPDTLGRDGSRAGWLELGRPPRELGLELAPLTQIEPRPGRLALFPSYVFHGTVPFSDGERLTVAFDVVPA